jgi:hypothetical protein
MARRPEAKALGYQPRPFRSTPSSAGPGLAGSNIAAVRMRVNRNEENDDALEA